MLSEAVADLRSKMAERCKTCRSEEMPYLWRCPAGVEGWTEGWHHTENDCDGFDDGNLCDASDLIDQYDPTGAFLGGEAYNTACVCACHAGWASFGEEPGECERCGVAADDYISDQQILRSDADCAFGHAVRRARTAEAEVADLRARLEQAERERDEALAVLDAEPSYWERRCIEARSAAAESRRLLERTASLLGVCCEPGMPGCDCMESECHSCDDRRAIRAHISRGGAK